MSRELRVGQAGPCVRLMIIHERPWPLATFGDNFTITVGQFRESLQVGKRETRWVRVRTLATEEKAAIAGRCDRFITETLKPRFLPEIRRTQFNYPVDIFGKWRGNKYSFITRYRSGFADNEGEEFDASFTRLDHVDEQTADIRFDLMWRRHSGQYWRLHSAVTLEDALRLIETEPLLRPNA
jgi:hypothetical protein